MFEIGDVSEKEFKRIFIEHPEWKNCKNDYTLYIINYGTSNQIEKREQMEIQLLPGGEYDCSRKVLVRGGPGAVRTVVWKVPPGADDPIP
jgi:hypothetical protein